MDSRASDFDLRADEEDVALAIVCGVVGLKSERDLGADGGRRSPADTTPALTVSALTSATAAFGAAIPNPR